MEIGFWILFSLILYTYFGYTLILFLLCVITFRLRSKDRKYFSESEWPEVTLLVAAYNEIDILQEKLENTRQIDYPKQKLKVVWITDGSTDATPEVLAKQPDVEVLHQENRAGKTAALNRAISFIKSPFTVFCDANTALDPQAIKRLISAFNNPKVGCVAGEKRIVKSPADSAAGSGEGAYWRYESLIKILESKLYSALSAAGELYAIRTELFEPVGNDVIIDDFLISLKIARKGYQIKYVPEAFATETASANIREELKRKIRIASGGFQAIGKIPWILNFFKYGLLSFEFISHKFLRWAIVPSALPLVFFLNLFLVIQTNFAVNIFGILFLLQLIFYFLVLLGVIIENRTTRFKFLFLPYYLIIMNYAQLAGLVRFLRKKQSAAWEKARRNASS